jgi:hypothetical protein
MEMLRKENFSHGKVTKHGFIGLNKHVILTYFIIPLL